MAEDPSPEPVRLGAWPLTHAGESVAISTSVDERALHCAEVQPDTAPLRRVVWKTDPGTRANPISGANQYQNAKSSRPRGRR